MKTPLEDYGITELAIRLVVMPRPVRVSPSDVELAEFGICALLCSGFRVRFKGNCYNCSRSPARKILQI